MFIIPDIQSPTLIRLRACGETKVLVLKPDEDRALLVGSLTQADFRIDRSSVAPIQFHLERHDGGVWIVPAYGFGDLRVNAARIAEATRLEEQNVVEFGDVIVDITVLGAGVADENPFAPDAAKLARNSYPASLPGSDETTQVAMRAVAAPRRDAHNHTTGILLPLTPQPVAPGGTERLAPYRNLAPASPAMEAPIPAQRTEPIKPFGVALLGTARPTVTASGTEVMQPFRSAAPVAEASARTPPPPDRPSHGSSASPVTPRTRLHAPLTAPAPWPGAPGPRADSTRAKAEAEACPPRPAAAIVPAQVRVLSKPPAVPPDANTLAAVIAHSGNTTMFDVPVVRAGENNDSALRFTTPERHFDSTPAGSARDASGRGPVSWLEQLGLLAKARPVLVAGGTLACSAVLTLVLVLASRFAHSTKTGQKLSNASAAPAALTTSLAAASPAPRASPPVQILSFARSSSATAAKTTNSSKGPTDASLVAATTLLVAGRYSEAKDAYADLARRTENTACYASIAQMLTRRVSPECATSSSPTHCPEIYR